MKIKLMTIAGIFLLVLSTPSFAQSVQGLKEMPPRRERLAANDDFPLAKENFLTEEQKEAFKVIRLETMKETKPLKDELRELRAHHQTLMTTENPDLNAIYASIDKMSEIESELSKIRAKSHLEMQSHLTDEQKLMFLHHREMKKQERQDDRPCHRHRSNQL